VTHISGSSDHQPAASNQSVLRWHEKAGMHLLVLCCMFAACFGVASLYFLHGLACPPFHALQRSTMKLRESKQENMQ
jgi:hypothetical protein